jgi:hypothetical protein
MNHGIGDDRIVQTRLFLWMSEEVDSRYLPHTIFCCVFSSTLLDKDVINQRKVLFYYSSFDWWWTSGNLPEGHCLKSKAGHT